MPDSPAPPLEKPISTIIYPVEDAKSHERALAELHAPDPTRERATAILKGEQKKEDQPADES